ncbi:matrixin family metalloprotease [Pseudonocardia sp.]|uniref:matrixin family metalloprotease n=1 Tax=Pseudonocardia sp. TaxID=60912 RepID=UPI003D0AB0EF
MTDPPGSSGLHPSAYGPPAGRWPDTALTYSVSTSGGVVLDTNGNQLTAAAMVQLIGDAFDQWAGTWSPLTLTRVPTNATPPPDIRARFVGTDVEPDFADPTVMGTGAYPPRGRIRFTTARNFTERSMTTTAIHEMGHALGLTHSGDRASVMYPWNLRLRTIDQDSRDAITDVYAPWSPQAGLPDRGTEDRPALASSGPAGFGGSNRELSAVWRGAAGDRTIYHSRYRNGSWTEQRRVPGAASTHGPALAQYSLRDGTAATGLLMLWKGAEGDSTLWWNVNPGDGDGWTTPHRIADVGTSARPALSYLGDTVAAWKGVEGDTGIYWASMQGAIWQPQQRVPDAESSHGPALAVLGRRLYLFFRDPEDSTLWYVSRGEGSEELWSTRRIVEADDYSLDTGGGVRITPGSSEGPAAATHLDRILLAWKGAQDDSGIYWCAFNGSEFSPQLQVDDVGTSTGPGLGSLDTLTYMMWKGVTGDNTLWWSEF